MIMNDAIQLEEALTLALRLSPKQRIQLIERIASSVEREFEPDLRDDASPSEEHWGRNLVRLLDEIGTIELVHPEIEDPAEWVSTLRRESRQRRLGDWGEPIDNPDDAE
jgi:hypothetical protein